jgi:hypothetical protein
MAMTSGEWLKRLNKRLDERQDRLAQFEAYYLGQHRLGFATSKFRETFGNLFQALAVNFCMLVVDAERERLNIEGFRFGDDPSVDADQEAWRIWQRNRLDARSSVAHSEALIKGESYILVWTNPAKPDTPLMRVQDCRRVYVEHDDGDEDARVAGIKRWQDQEEYERCNLYLPDRIEKYRSRAKARAGSLTVRSDDHWQKHSVPGEAWPLPNTLGVVPLVPLVNNPMLTGPGRSELAAVIPIQDAINKTVADMLVASEFVAFPQRWATGIDVPIDETTGLTVEPFKAAVNRLWIADVQQGLDQTIEPKFGQFPQASLDPYVHAVEMLVQHIASITKTPAHYLLGQSGSFPSGESLKATETGLVAKTRGAMRYFGEGWEEAMRLALQLTGSANAGKSIEVIWRDPESRVQSEITDAIGKQVQILGVPRQIAWEKVGYSQVEIQRMEILLQQEALETAAVAPLAPPPGGPSPRPAPGGAPVTAGSTLP